MKITHHMKPRAEISGQIIVRHQGPCPLGDGRKLVMVVGILAVPANTTLKNEHQYPVLGDTTNALRIMDGLGRDVGHLTVGEGASGMLIQPIWMV